MKAYEKHKDSDEENNGEGEQETNDVIYLSNECLNI